MVKYTQPICWLLPVNCLGMFDQLVKPDLQKIKNNVYCSHFHIETCPYVFVHSNKKSFVMITVTNFWIVQFFYTNSRYTILHNFGREKEAFWEIFLVTMVWTFGKCTFWFWVAWFYMYIALASKKIEKNRKINKRPPRLLGT